MLYIQPGDEYTRICIPNITTPDNLPAQILHDHHDATFAVIWELAKHSTPYQGSFTELE